ncbi:hypothetical protein O181_132302 [Austropuccinia psidii MF-1]|uniref:Uncharacterized protein n=1 Tax=Austropuccinia psidii MF-1 TaxID=1389203 RepID=A0A9Q3L4R0_9BASI|nr:hypothetical protein [Austropuccinia psidii MF-1]
MDLGTGSLKITHNAKFLPTILPSSETEDSCTGNKPFTLFQSEPNTGNPHLPQSKPGENSVTPQKIETEVKGFPINNVMKDLNFLTYKEYSWIQSS